MLEYNPYSKTTQFNPYPVYRSLRNEARVYTNEALGFYALSRHDDVLAALLDPVTYSSTHGNTLEGQEAGLDMLTVKDPPEHAWHRRVVSRMFTPRHVEPTEAAIREVAGELLDAARDRGEIDIVGDFSARLPLWVISELLGIPFDVRDTVCELSSRVTSRGDEAADGEVPEDSVAAMVELVGLLQDVARHRRATPGDDLLSMLLTTPVTDEDGNETYLTNDQVAGRFLELAVAGHETVARLVANGTVALDWYPDQRRQLAEDPRLIPGAVEEMLRWDPPAQYLGRWVTRPVELDGTTIPAGMRVLLLIGSATHDDRIYPEPELFDIHRQIQWQLGFGFGPHLCVGAPLARLEARIAFEELLARYPDYQVEAPGAVRGDSTILRGLRRLPVRLGAPARAADSGD